ncbi:MAG TPA: response regulator [Terracidiphilus sp.]|jgi:DNA-binding NtrC family response regulator|nr:response regulator [Terracidiphilus sp.]
MSTQSLRVLVVDDEPAIADSLAEILRYNGHQAAAEYNAEQAILTAGSLDPQVLISDVIMPDMNGIELANYFALHFPGCKVLLISGSETTTGLLNDAKRHGHEFAFMQKPIPPQLILDFLDHCDAP